MKVWYEVDFLEDYSIFKAKRILEDIKLTLEEAKNKGIYDVYLDEMPNLYTEQNRLVDDLIFFLEHNRKCHY